MNLKNILCGFLMNSIGPVACSRDKANEHSDWMKSEKFADQLRKDQTDSQNPLCPWNYAQ
jgi:hypothetical protein